MAKMPAEFIGELGPLFGKDEDRLTRNSTPGSYLARSLDISPLPSHQKPVEGGKFTVVDRSVIESCPVPCVVYECTANLLVTNISSNSIELVGIQLENIVGKRLISEERMPIESCKRLRDQLDQLEPMNAVSAVHPIADDHGLPIWVAHSIRKVQASGRDVTFVGCLTPIASDFVATKLDASIISQFVHKIGNHFQLINLLIGSLTRVGANVEEVEALQQTIDRAVEFTRSFSHFSQPVGCLTMTDVGDVLSSATKLAALVCLEKDVSFQGVQDRDALSGALVLGDAFLLEVAFGAVFQNALEATNIGDQISVDARSEMEQMTGRGFARIVVTDNGPGIDADVLAKVADPFVTSKRDRDGLGLSTAVRIITIHGGTLKITSAPQQGTRVEIVLPITQGCNKP